MKLINFAIGKPFAFFAILLNLLPLYVETATLPFNTSSRERGSVGSTRFLSKEHDRSMTIPPARTEPEDSLSEELETDTTTSSASNLAQRTATTKSRMIASGFSSLRASADGATTPDGANQSSLGIYDSIIKLFLFEYVKTPPPPDTRTQDSGGTDEANKDKMKIIIRKNVPVDYHYHTDLALCRHGLSMLNSCVIEDRKSALSSGYIIRVNATAGTEYWRTRAALVDYVYRITLRLGGYEEMETFFTTIVILDRYYSKTYDRNSPPYPGMPHHIALVCFFIAAKTVGKRSLAKALYHNSHAKFLEVVGEVSEELIRECGAYGKDQLLHGIWVPLKYEDTVMLERRVLCEIGHFVYSSSPYSVIQIILWEFYSQRPGEKRKGGSGGDGRPDVSNERASGRCIKERSRGAAVAEYIFNSVLMEPLAMRTPYTLLAIASVLVALHIQTQQGYFTLCRALLPQIMMQHPDAYSPGEVIQAIKLCLAWHLRPSIPMHCTTIERSNTLRLVQPNLYIAFKKRCRVELMAHLAVAGSLHMLKR